MLEILKDLERGLKSATDKAEKDLFIGLLKEQIAEHESKASDEELKLINKLRSEYLGAKKKPTSKTTKKPTPKTTKKPRAKLTPEQKAKNKEKIKTATGKTIEECKEILAKYEALRGKTVKKDVETAKKEKQRVQKLKDEDKIIDGTNVKTADATTETTAKEIPKKIKKEVDAIEKEAEQEAKKEVNPKGKTKAEVKKEVEEVKIEKIEEKVKDMTKDLAEKSNELIDAMTNTIAELSPSKEEAIKFLMDIRNHIDVLLKANKFEFGGAVQSYDIAWMGGRPMPMFEKGGKFADGGKVSKGDDALKQAEELFNDTRSLERRLREERRLAVETDKDRSSSIGVLKRRIRMNKELAKRMSYWAFSVNDGMNKEKYSKYLNYLNQINPTIKSYSKGGKFADGGDVSDIDTIYVEGKYRDDGSDFYENQETNDVAYVVEDFRNNDRGLSSYRIYIRFNDGTEREITKDDYSKGGKFADKKIVQLEDGNYYEEITVDRRNEDGISQPYVYYQEIEEKSKGGKFADGGEVGDYKLEKIVNHYDGRDWMLDEYPSFIDNGDSDDWLGMSEISLERAKQLAFELGGDEAYDVMEEINEAETIEELQDAISDLKYYQRDNTYNQSWWGGVIDFGVLTEDGEGYGTGLVILRMHRGGDPRGNYYDYAVYELDSFIEDFPPYFARLTYQIEDKDGNYASFDTEDMEGYRLYVNEDNITDLEEGDSITIDELEEKFGVDVYAKGGKLPKKTKLGRSRDWHKRSKESHELAYQKRKKSKGKSEKKYEIEDTILVKPRHASRGDIKDLYDEIKENMYEYKTFKAPNNEADYISITPDNFSERNRITEYLDDESWDYEEYKKGGKLPRKKGLGWKRDMERLSKEPHEQAYKSKRKGDYSSFKRGGYYGGDGEEYIYPSEEQRIDEMVEHWNKEGWASSSVSKQGDDGDFFDRIGVDSMKVGITSQTGNDIIYYDVNRPSYFNRGFAKGGKTNWVQNVVDSPNFREGAFRRKAEARGMSTDAFMNQVLHSPHLYDERTRKQAQFMKNAFND